MPPPAYRTRLDILFAREAPRAVILRRGPRRHFHLIAWDLRKDRFEHGQWMKGHVRLCDLSPDGDKLIYWAHQYHAPFRHRAEISASRLQAYDPLRQNLRARSPKKREMRRKTPRYQRGFGEAVGARRPARAM